MIVINFKTYKQGKGVVKLARNINKRGVIKCCQTGDIGEVSKLGGVVFGQHVDYHDAGRATGYVLPEQLKSLGASGSLLNHSEHRMWMAVIKKTVKRCKKARLKLIICAASLREAKKLKRLKPWAIAYEDPELVGSGKSITKYKGEEVGKFAKVLKGSNIIALCGAGINSKEDVVEAKRLGCRGVLVSSAVTKSKSPEKLVEELIEAQ